VLGVFGGFGRRIRSRSNSSTKSIDKLDEQLEPVSHIFAQNNDLPIDFILFKYILENFTNKKANINDLCKQIGTDIPNLLKIVEVFRPSLTDRSIKIKMTKLANLLFQVSSTFEMEFLKNDTSTKPTSTKSVIELKRCRAILQQIININKTNSWRNFTSNINHKTTSKVITNPK
jgi:hypothetical protein